MQVMARRDEEAVDIAFLNAVFFSVELALDGVKLAGASGACDKINASVVGDDCFSAGTSASIQSSL